MVTHIAIPVRDQLHLTRSIVAQLQHQSGWDKCWIFDNGSTDDTWDFLISNTHKDRRFWPVMASQDGIYDMWDEGFTLSRHEGADFLAILNNDLELAPNTIEHLTLALRNNPDAWISYPDYNASSVGQVGYRRTSGTFRHGGMSGFCFMLRVAPIDWAPLVDPQFIWWGGDDDIAFEVEKRGGKQVRVLGLPVTHLLEGTARHHDLGAQKGADLDAVIKKWGR